MSRVFITGDTHGDFKPIAKFCNKNNTNIDDVLIILGDSGINYYSGYISKSLKETVSVLPIKLFCIHGNHEERPENIPTYLFDDKMKVWHEPQYPNILFAKDNTVYRVNNKNYYVFGGAYSVDKYYRLSMGYKWFDSEQNMELIKKMHKDLDTDEWVKTMNDYNNLTVLSHTCPFKYIPSEAFLPMIDQSTVDNSMEHMLNKLEEKITYSDWYCGHWHINKNIDKIHFLFHNIVEVI